jgi:hypothetical protein
MLLFNGPVEVGIRTVILLNAVFPQSLDLNRITILDHWTLHSGMFGDLPSVHPDRANSLGELGLKRGTIEQGLQLMRSAGMVSLIASAEGISYRATEEAAGFLGLMEAPLVAALGTRAEWAINHFAELTDTQAHQSMLAPLHNAEDTGNGNVWPPHA